MNVNGGAIALGHPIGATGSILMTKLHFMNWKEQEKIWINYPMYWWWIQGITTIVENRQI